MKNRCALIQVCLLGAVLLLCAKVQAQFLFTTNNDGSINISQYTGSGGVVVIPDTTNGLPITTIGNSAFGNISGLSVSSVTIGTNVVSIGGDAFFGCSSLTNIAIGNNVTNIGGDAFVACGSLTTVIIPNSVTSIGISLFSACTNLSNVTIGTNVTSIGNDAFLQCASLASFIIPNGVTNLGVYAFSQCTSLTNITISNSLTSIEAQTFFKCTSPTSVMIPSSVTVIGSDAFFGCSNLTSVTFGGNIINIGHYAFTQCYGLINVYFGGNAPTPINDTSVFSSDTNATVYYLPNKTGWGSSFDGLPTMPWNPQVQKDASFGVQNDQFGFNITGSSNLVIVVEACTNLANPVWLPVSTNTLNTYVGTNGTSYFSDPQWTNNPAGFYRFRSP